MALLRVPQWTKSGFVLIPLFFSKKIEDPGAVATSIAAALVFALFSGAVYSFNDYMDRVEDAQHPLKWSRPLASGELGGRDALGVGAGALVLASAIGLFAGLPAAFWATMGVYVAIQIAYSTGLRSVVLVDVAVIASGFVLRILAGTTALRVEASSYILLAAGFLALLLALGKRRTDLNLEAVPGRRSLDGYTIEFIDLALASLAATVIGVYAEFTVSEYSLRHFGRTHLYLTTFLVAIGVIRYLQVIVVERQFDSPTDIVLRDRPLQAIIACWLAMFAVMAYG
jgi:decaprenyl-phosphate phosphoribosyltransferase